MSTTFRPYAPDQSLLLPPDVRAWLPEGHLAHHVSDLVDGLDLTAFYVPYEGDGRRNAPYEPRMMVKVLIYAYATGVFSSRGVARKLEEDVAFRMLAATVPAAGGPTSRAPSANGAPRSGSGRRGPPRSGRSKTTGPHHQRGAWRPGGWKTKSEKGGWG